MSLPFTPPGNHVGATDGQCRRSMSAVSVGGQCRRSVSAVNVGGQCRRSVSAVNVGGQCRRSMSAVNVGGQCRRSMSAVSVYATYATCATCATCAPLETRRKGLGRGKNRLKIMNICSSLLLNVMIHFPYGLHSLTRSISALSGFRPQISVFVARPRRYPPPVSILCLYTCRFTGKAGIFSRLYGAGSYANANHTNGARRIVVSDIKLCLLSEKNLSMSEMDKVGGCANEKLTIPRPIPARSRIAIVPGYSGK